MTLGLVEGDAVGADDGVSVGDFVVLPAKDDGLDEGEFVGDEV